MESKYYKFSIVDFFRAYVFRRKCPICNKTLKGMKKTGLIRKGDFSISGTNYYGNVYRVKFYCKCNNCNKEYDLWK